MGPQVAALAVPSGPARPHRAGAAGRACTAVARCTGVALHAVGWPNCPCAPPMMQSLTGVRVRLEPLHPLVTAVLRVRQGCLRLGLDTVQSASLVALSLLLLHSCHRRRLPPIRTIATAVRGHAGGMKRHCRTACMLLPGVPPCAPLLAFQASFLASPPICRLHDSQQLGAAADALPGCALALRLVQWSLIAALFVKLTADAPPSCHARSVRASSLHCATAGAP